MNNYEKMMEAARRRFTGYDMDLLAQKAGATDGGETFSVRFFGQEVRICKRSGDMTVDGRPAGFGETLSVLDWLCDGKPDAAAAGEYCPVSTLSRVYVSGSNLSMAGDAFAERIQQNPERFCAACEKLGGKAVQMGDLGYRIPIFADLSMCLKFYYADEEFPAVLNYLWDRNTLSFVRYETIYYIAGCLRRYLMREMENA